MVELQIVVLAVAGSSPVGHPISVQIYNNPRDSQLAAAKDWTEERRRESQVPTWKSSISAARTRILTGFCAG